VQAQLTPLDGGAGAQPAVAWQPEGLPAQKEPATRFDIVELDGRRVLRLSAERSYGNLVHALPSGDAGRWLSWRWRVDQPNPRADLRQRGADDAAVKVCAMFDLPLDAVPFAERQLLRLARARSSRPLPSATLCYVWDIGLPEGTVLDNAYTRRVRLLVVRGSGSPSMAWRDERRDLHADFLRLFGDESRQVPPLSAIAVGADADNTAGQSLAFVDGLKLQP
jgi:hypothetical protein